jgi:hypothetical protein
MKQIFIFLPVSALFVGLLHSCKKESNTPEQNENELITTVTMTAVPAGTTDTVTFIWEDMDGPGGDNPLIDTIKLKAATVYAISMALYDKTKTPVEFSNTEIIEESDVHRFYFTPSSGTGITISDPDKDKNGISLGLSGKLSTTTTGAGELTVTLRHYADGGKEEADEVNDVKSSTDAEATFPVVVD